MDDRYAGLRGMIRRAWRTFGAFDCIPGHWEESEQGAIDWAGKNTL